MSTTSKQKSYQRFRCQVRHQDPTHNHWISVIWVLEWNHPSVILQCRHSSDNSGCHKTWPCWPTLEGHHVCHIGYRNTMGRPVWSWWNSTVARRQQANETCVESQRIFENSETMEEALKHQIIETIEDTYILELCNRYTWFVGVKKIYLDRIQV